MFVRAEPKIPFAGRVSTGKERGGKRQERVRRKHTTKVIERAEYRSCVAWEGWGRTLLTLAPNSSLDISPSFVRSSCWRRKRNMT